MKRAISTLSAALLLMACEGKEPGETATQGVSPTSDATGDDDTTGDGATVTSAAETEGPSVTTGVSVTTSDTDAGTTGDTCSFVCDTTSGPVDDPMCDNWAQDCPDDQKCAAYANDGGNSWNSLKCVAVQQNPGEAGDPCTVEGGGVSGIDSCNLGSMCWAVDNETGQGTCVSLCSGSPQAASCGGADTSCVIANEGVLNLCLGKCDPLQQDCLGSELCLPNPNDPDGFVCVLDASGDTGTAFDPCEYANACDAGFVCQDPGFAQECDPGALGCCLPYCDTSEPQCPGVGQGCIAWYEEGTAPPNYELLGLCGIPQG